ncbi:hypothetical protein CR513_30669, partial [Mucuna pruriens]
MTLPEDDILNSPGQDSTALLPGQLDWGSIKLVRCVKTWRDLAAAFLRQYKYNKDMASDRSRLQNLSKMEPEGFKEYAQRWWELAT